MFNAEKLVNFAEDLVYLSRLKDLFKQELREPSEGLVRYALDTAKLVDGRITQAKIDRFQPLIKQSVSSAILEIVGQSFRPQPVASNETEEPTPEAGTDDATLSITPSEREAYDLTVSLLENHLPEPDRLKYRKNATYLAIMYGETRKWFVRYTIDSRLKQAAYIRLPVERVRELAPFSKPEPAPPALGETRVYFDEVSELRHLNNVLIEAAQTTTKESDPSERKRKTA